MGYYTDTMRACEDLVMKNIEKLEREYKEAQEIKKMIKNEEKKNPVKLSKPNYIPKPEHEKKHKGRKPSVPQETIDEVERRLKNGDEMLQITIDTNLSYMFVYKIKKRLGLCISIDKDKNIAQKIKVIDLYKTGNYTKKMIASELNIAYHIVCKYLQQELYGSGKMLKDMTQEARENAEKLAIEARSIAAIERHKNRKKKNERLISI